MRYSNPDRRTILKSMTSLAAASSMAKITVGRADAAPASDPALSPALGDVDQALRQAVNARIVPGVVAIAENDKGIVYEGAFGSSITADSVFWDWITGMVGGVLPIPRYDGRIEVQDPSGDRVVAVWTFDQALPSKVMGPTLNAKTGEVAIEELHMVHEGLRLGERP